jgi:glycerophosphoryl diester phosphodiesterase
MYPIFDQLPRPAIFAHRGACAHAPENTLAAFELALRQGSDAVELDAKLSADGQVVVIHDMSVDRTTNGSGRVRDMTLAKLQELDAGSHFDVAFRGERIPTLEQVFESVGRSTFINVELTNYTSPMDHLPDRVVDLVKKHGLEARIIFSSFNPLALIRARRLLPETPIGLIAFPGIKGALSRGALGRLIPYQSLHPAVVDANPGLIGRAHKEGRKVYVYTVNDPDEMRVLFDRGVDGIFTDDPLLAHQTLMSAHSSSSAA